ncbi:MAG: hypothetical protein GY869_08020, partial [Planctomycetes bacterium]|nr:hypothetical protein [Planctomycetota bacterium]
SGVTALAAGDFHTCVLTGGGGVGSGGGRARGQLCEGADTSRHTPVAVSGLSSGVTALAVGLGHTCAVTGGGGVKCWGQNSSGQLGDGTTTDHLTPVDVSGLSSGVTALAALRRHTCAVTGGGGVKCWGYNNRGQLGDGTTTDRPTPVAVIGLSSGVTALAVGGHHTCAVTGGGDVKCWGYNRYGQLGDGTITNRYTPVDVVGFEGTPDTKMVYIGPSYLPQTDYMIGEIDGVITLGDHVRLRLPFKNIGSVPLTDAEVEIQGGSDPAVSIYNGITWSNPTEYLTVALSPVINPDEIGYADIWIYVKDIDYADRKSLYGIAWLIVRTDIGKWEIPISLEPIRFDISGNTTLKNSSCLHNPDEPKIQYYAQFAAGNPEMANPPPTNNGDPDSPEQAVENLVNRVGDREKEFDYEETREERLPDTTLLKTRGGTIGPCSHYADLTIGLLRSLGIPSRYVRSWFWVWSQFMPAHTWAEVYLNGGEWRQVDSTWKTAFSEGIYEASGVTVLKAYADEYPLSSASHRAGLQQYLCISSCYQEPVDCTSCLRDSKAYKSPLNANTLCVEDVTSSYHNVTNSSQRIGIASNEELLIHLQSPISVTQTVPFTLTTSIVNSTTLSLNNITTTIAISNYLDSKLSLFDVTPPYEITSNVNAGQAITFTWVVTPLLSGSSIPLRVVARSEELFQVVEQPLVVNEPGTLPDLSMGGVCGLGTISPGGIVTLTAYVLDEYLQPLTDTTNLITATIFATPTLLYSTTVNLPYCNTCGQYQNVVNMPNTIPTGDYQVDFVATRPGYEADSATTFFFVTPPLSLNLSANQDSVGMDDTLTLTTQVFDRGIVITDASVRVDIQTPAGELVAPMIIEGGDFYTLIFRPTDLAANLNGQVMPGSWFFQVTADYLGSETTSQMSIDVISSVYLPTILK